MVKNTVITQKKLQDLLDSDDELPNTYSEIAEIPAYQDDNRFNHIFARNKKIVQPPKSPLRKKPHNKSADFIRLPDKANSTVSDHLLVKTKKIVQPSESPLSDNSNKSIDLIHSSNKDNSTVLVRNKKILQPSENLPSEKSNNNNDLICAPDKDISTVLNKNIDQQAERHFSEKSNKSTDLIDSSDKDSSTELSFFADAMDEQENFENRLLINKGVLSQQEIVCIKCIEATENNSTIIWFINYLLCKDMQSKYTHLSSCLVGNWENHVNNHEKDNVDTNKCDFHLEIVIKCK